ncbi:hypothetical protein DFH09DRAFT_1080522 [Mycena vulgaris]|nr:hypothetical protein DFH09DRAFT_1080522 [Mycena vulgaris]
MCSAKAEARSEDSSLRAGEFHQHGLTAHKLLHRPASRTRATNGEHAAVSARAACGLRGALFVRKQSISGGNVRLYLTRSRRTHGTYLLPNRHNPAIASAVRVIPTTPHRVAPHHHERQDVRFLDLGGIQPEESTSSWMSSRITGASRGGTQSGYIPLPIAGIPPAHKRRPQALMLASATARQLIYQRSREGCGALAELVPRTEKVALRAPLLHHEGGRERSRKSSCALYGKSLLPAGGVSERTSTSQIHPRPLPHPPPHLQTERRPRSRAPLRAAACGVCGDAAVGVCDAQDGSEGGGAGIARRARAAAPARRPAPAFPLLCHLVRLRLRVGVLGRVRKRRKRGEGRQAELGLGRERGRGRGGVRREKGGEQRGGRRGAGNVEAEMKMWGEDGRRVRRWTGKEGRKGRGAHDLELEEERTKGGWRKDGAWDRAEDAGKIAGASVKGPGMQIEKQQDRQRTMIASHSSFSPSPPPAPSSPPIETFTGGARKCENGRVDDVQARSRAMAGAYFLQRGQREDIHQPDSTHLGCKRLRLRLHIPACPLIRLRLGRGHDPHAHDPTSSCGSSGSPSASSPTPRDAHVGPCGSRALFEGVCGVTDGTGIAMSTATRARRCSSAPSSPGASAALLFSAFAFALAGGCDEEGVGEGVEGGGACEGEGEGGVYGATNGCERTSGSASEQGEQAIGRGRRGKGVGWWGGTTAERGRVSASERQGGNGKKARGRGRMKENGKAEYGGRGTGDGGRGTDRAYDAGRTVRRKYRARKEKWGVKWNGEVGGGRDGRYDHTAACARAGAERGTRRGYNARGGGAERRGEEKGREEAREGHRKGKEAKWGVRGVRGGLNATQRDDMRVKRKGERTRGMREVGCVENGETKGRKAMDVIRGGRDGRREMARDSDIAEVRGRGSDDGAGMRENDQFKGRMGRREGVPEVDAEDGGASVKGPGMQIEKQQEDRKRTTIASHSPPPTGTFTGGASCEEGVHCKTLGGHWGQRDDRAGQRTAGLRA